MTAELQKLATDPNFLVEFAVGDPAPTFVPQEKAAGINFAHVFFSETKRYVLKKARFSADDLRIFDYGTGRLVLVSHHPGKNPYGALDPLDLTNADAHFGVAGGEWSSVCDISSNDGAFHSFKIRPKSLSRHGRQYIKTVDDEIVLNVGKMGKLKSMSIRDHFVCGQGSSTDLVYKCVADYTGRSVQVFNEKEELVAQIAKTTKALIKTAVFGGGSESTIDIAPGVDCSTILALVFGMKQVGAHFMNDAFNNFVADPVKDAALQSVVDGGAADGVSQAYEGASEQVEGILEGQDADVFGSLAEAYEGASEDAGGVLGVLAETGRFFVDSFFGEE